MAVPENTAPDLLRFPVIVPLGVRIPVQAGFRTTDRLPVKSDQNIYLDHVRSNRPGCDLFSCDRKIMGLPRQIEIGRRLSETPEGCRSGHRFPELEGIRS